VASRTWEAEEASDLLRKLETSLAPIGFHVMMPKGFPRKGSNLELYVFPRATTNDERSKIGQVLHAEMKRIDKKLWSFGRGKKTKRVELSIQD
jgi:hypothetical protein